MDFTFLKIKPMTSKLNLSNFHLKYQTWNWSHMLPFSSHISPISSQNIWIPIPTPSCKFIPFITSSSTHSTHNTFYLSSQNLKCKSSFIYFDWSQTEKFNCGRALGGKLMMDELLMSPTGQGGSGVFVQSKRVPPDLCNTAPACSAEWESIRLINSNVTTSVTHRVANKSNAISRNSLAVNWAEMLGEVLWGKMAVCGHWILYWSV